MQLPRRAVPVPNMILGLSRRAPPLPDLEDSGCSTDDSRRVQGAEGAACERDGPVDGAFSCDGGVLSRDRGAGGGEAQQPSPSSRGAVLGDNVAGRGGRGGRGKSSTRTDGLHPLRTDLLRTGTDYSQLTALADDTYRCFLDDLIGEGRRLTYYSRSYSNKYVRFCMWCLYVCRYHGALVDAIASSRARASSASTAEELAMHRVLAEFVNKTFSEPDFVFSLRKQMVAAATDMSLSYN